MKLSTVPRTAGMFLSLMFLTLGQAFAQPIFDFDDIAKANFHSGIAAFEAFSVEEGMTGGTYKFKNSGSPDADMDIYKYIGEFRIGDSKAQFVPLVTLTPSYLRFDQDFTQGGDLSVVNWSGGVGTGLLMKFFDDTLEITPRFKAQYSDADYSVSIPGVEKPVIDSFVPEIESMTYIPSLQVSWRQVLADDGGALILDSKLSYLYVDAKSSKGTLGDFSDHSWIWRSRIAYEQPIGDLLLRPNLARMDAYGAARDGFGFNSFYELGTELVSRKAGIKLLSEVGASVTYVYEEEIQGWRFGILGKFA